MKRSIISLFLILAAFMLSACFFTATGDTNLVATLSVLETQVAKLSTQETHQDEIISYLATQVRSLPVPPSADPQVPTPYYPVIGGILIEGGSCCVGGVAGETIEIEVAIETRNPETGGAVEQMRIASGSRTFGEPEMNELAWEDFTPTKTFYFLPPINWVGFYVCVQFRDVNGDLSQVYCDDISVEGMPPSPTP